MRSNGYTDQGMSICTWSKSPPLVGAVGWLRATTSHRYTRNMKQLEFTDHLFIYTDYTQFNIFILFAMVVDDGGLKQAC